jgi:hypothetical protein
MWFGILTPGAHPSRRRPTRDDATVLGWTAADRRRIDGPAAELHGGLRVVRRLLHANGLDPAPPRCFVCLEPCGVPDAEAERARPDVLRTPPGTHLPSPETGANLRAVLAFVHLADLAGDEDPSLEEEALIALPQQVFSLLVPLAVLPGAIGLLPKVLAGEPPPRCLRCGTLLPGGVDQRNRVEARTARREAERRGRRATRRRAA